VKKLTDVNVSLNNEAVFHIEFDGSPMPQVKWFRNGLELSSTGRYRINTKAGESKSTLTFLEAWDNDNQAKISCEIVNPLGRETCEALLHVKGKVELKGARARERERENGQ
jgi:Immunoglobulin I-set domain